MTTIQESLQAAFAHHEAGDLAAASQIYRQILAVDPQNATARHRLGVVALQSNQLEPAARLIGDAIRLDGSQAIFHFHLGEVLCKSGQLADARRSFEQALRLDPNLAHAQLGLANVLRAEGRFDAAGEACRRAIELAPNLAEAHGNLSELLRLEGAFDAALDSSATAVRLQPENARLRYNRGMLLLQTGDFAAGWPEYSWRWHVAPRPRPPFPEWDGSSLEGRTILLYVEQGFGDTVQFIRYAALVKRLGATVVLACPESSIPILSTCAGVDRCAREGDLLGDVNVQAALVNLPGIFHTELDSIPADVPYLTADAALVDRWRAQLGDQQPAGDRPFRVGIAWQGSPTHADDRRRSIPLAEFAPLAAVEGVRLVSLQKGFGSQQLDSAGFAVDHFGNRLDAAGGDFCDTAALVKNLDLVVTCDSAVGHLAGALAAPTWIGLTFSPDWRWMLERSDSPWYSTVRLFRQTKTGDWRGVFEHMAAALSQQVARRRT